MTDQAQRTEWAGNGSQSYRHRRDMQPETLTDLVERWRKRAATLENGDGAARLAAYQLRFAADELKQHITDAYMT